MLAEIRSMMRPGDFLLLGADRVKDEHILEAAYDDAQGHTARFNLNVLNVLNRELDADFPVDNFSHRAWFNAEDSRIEMRLRATSDHRVRFGKLNAEIEIAAGEEILTEVSRKFTDESLSQTLKDAGLALHEHLEAPDAAYSLVIAGVIKPVL